jgi:hypothetical protein
MLSHDFSARSTRNTMSQQQDKLSQEKQEVIRNLYVSGIAEEFIAMQLDVEIPNVIEVLKEQGVYKSD